jgi:Uma2 family endonuclease
MQKPVARPATYDDLIAAPEHLVAEIVGGELHTSPRPGSRRTRTSSRLGGLLLGPFDSGRGEPGGWVVLDEPELHLGADVMVPDLAGWRRERMPEMPDVPFFTLAPDWICEVLSPSTARLDRADKLPRYAGAGVAHAWLIDPLLQTLEVLRRAEADRWLLLAVHQGDAVVRAEPFEAIELELSLLWSR